MSRARDPRMTMDFFEHQETARRKTGLLVVLFALAVIIIIALTYVAVATFLMFYDDGTFEPEMGFLDPVLLLVVGTCVIALVAGGSGFKLLSLRSGGESVATMLGGRLIDPGSANPAERQLLNVVEEMSIASGTPVPPVYLLEEESSINAFAAGYSPHDAVIGVTRGTVELLDRDQLQGVIAHEFSHILNGDMRLNIRLIGILHGILVIGLAGAMLLRAMMYAPRTRSSRGKGGSGAGAIAALGLALFVIGYAGTFFGKLIKSAVSRQREYLADAAAVQFTRYPPGIAGALKKIGGLKSGSRLAASRAEEASHMYFGAGVKFMIGLLSTHPPLPERIRRIEPSWDGSFPEADIRDVRRRAEATASRRPEREAGFEGLELTAMMGAAGAPAGVLAVQEGIESQRGLDRIGRPSAAHIAYARELISRIPEPLKGAAREPFGARAVVYGLLLDEEPDVRQIQWRQLDQHADEQVVRLTRGLESHASQLSRNARLPLLEMCLPALRELSSNQYATFAANMRRLIEADERVDVFDWVLQRLVTSALEPQFTKSRPPIVQYYSLRGLRPECETLLTVLASVGHDDLASSRRAFNAGVPHLGLSDLKMRRRNEISWNSLNDTLRTLRQVTPKIRSRLIEACAACICADREVTAREGEILRAVADALDCPMPPILPGQPIV